MMVGEAGVWKPGPKFAQAHEIASTFSGVLRRRWPPHWGRPIGTPPGPNRARTGLNALKARVKVRGLAAIDRRTAAARAGSGNCWPTSGRACRLHQGKSTERFSAVL